ncbi:MAG: AGE family epimerase/isomerase [Paludibacteraceae bacterium]
MKQLVSQVRSCLTDNILPYWIRLQDPLRGGFYGQVTGKEVLVPDAPRGAILNARILWTFAAAYRLLGTEEYLHIAERQYRYFTARFIDPIHGGVYWSVTADGQPLDTHKQTYAQAFALYALAEYAQIDTEALPMAIRIYQTIEQYTADPVFGGYIEGLSADWQPLDDMRLSDHDKNTAKSQNTHLHILEAYTALYRVWSDPVLKSRIQTLHAIFRNRLMDADTRHINLFFNLDWSLASNEASYGHDIETSWLMDEALTVIGEQDDDFVWQVGRAADEGLNSDGSLRYETHDAHIQWWVMAEAVVGYFNLYTRFGDPQDLARAEQAWHYIDTRLIDHRNGEWYWDCAPDGTPNTADDKAGFWKCPYHNARMCMEIIRRNS